MLLGRLLIFPGAHDLPAEAAFAEFGHRDAVLEVLGAARLHQKLELADRTEGFGDASHVSVLTLLILTIDALILAEFIQWVTGLLTTLPKLVLTCLYLLDKVPVLLSLCIQDHLFIA